MDTTTPLKLLRKLRNIQREAVLKKDKKAQITSSFAYNYTTMASLWETVEPLLFQENLLLSWYEEYDGIQGVLVTYVTDLDSGETLKSKHIIRATHTESNKTTFDTKGYTTGEKGKVTGHVQTKECDFRTEGAYYSYWKRMCAISLLGLITSDDISAEESYWTGKSEEPDTTQQTSTSSKKRYAF